MPKKQLRIGLFGFGTVGRGLYDLLRQIPTPGVSIAKVCIRHIDKERHIEVPVTDKADDIFTDPEINFIVELVDDAQASYQIVRRALEQGLPVVSGNKKMLARHLPELMKLSREKGVSLLYDASSCGSIPVIRNLEEYYDNDLLISVKGILNGSSNFVLSKIFNDHMNHEEALQLASQMGFLESDPTLDLDGWDSLYKLVIITVHAFGTYVPPEDVFTFGITHMNDADILFSREKDRRIKLVAHVEKRGDTLALAVMPQLISRNKYIYSVEDEFNGVVIKGYFYGKQFMFGQGAGAAPTASAVLSDITACLYGYRYEYKKIQAGHTPVFSNDSELRIYYRFTRPEDGHLLPFVRVTESYRSEGNCYTVGTVTLADLHSAMNRLRDRDVFLAAYPDD